jgi:glutamyl-tRNA synthetase
MSNNEQLRSRLAPTPSGYLHKGNLCSFINTWLTVRKSKGKLLLRIDDIDNERSRPEYVQDIFDWLQVLGIDYDTGPRSVQDFKRHWSQQLRLPLYQLLLQQLVSTGMVYACDCSRKKIMENSRHHLYNGECRNKKIPLDAADVVWRLRVADGLVLLLHDEKMGHQLLKPSFLIGDFVIRRKNGLPSYQVASLADDVYFDINYIVRGEDLLPSTAAQWYMASLLHLESFLQARFCHHPLLLDAEGNKLSKSAGAQALPKPRPTEKESKDWWNTLAKDCGIAQRQSITSLQDLLHFAGLVL